MIRILLKHEYEFPSEWEELNQEQALRIFTIIDRLKEKKVNLTHARAEFFMYLASLCIPKEKREGAFWENVFQASSGFRFFYKYVYLGDEFNNFSPETQKQLEKYLPEELEQTPEVRIASKLQPGYIFDMVFGKNLVTSKVFKGKKLTSYSFTNDAGFINTSLTAAQYVDAITVLNEYKWTSEGPEQQLDLLCSILFCELPYKTSKAFASRGIFCQLPRDFKIAVMYNFTAICQWLQTKTQYSILWLGKKKEGKSIPVSASDMIYSISKAGYGSPEQVGQMNLTEMLDLMKKILLDSLRAMLAAKIKPIEVANATGMPMKLILELT
jgi:hypothetical protein